MDIRETVRQFVIQNFLFGDAAGLADDGVSLLDSGVMDSIGVMELVGFLEGDLQLTVPDDDLTPDNLDSVDKLVKYIEANRGAQ